MSIAEKKRQARKRDEWYLLGLRGGLVALMLGLFVWLAHDRLLEASLFLAVGMVYSFLVWRVASRSVRAFNVMLVSLLLNYYTLISMDVTGVLTVPAAGPWFLGFLVGAIAGGHVWLGPGRGTEFAQKNRRRPDADGNYTGGWGLALINAVCALLLLGIGSVQLALLSPTILAVAVLVASFLAGWILFRFPPTLRARDGLTFLVLPVVYFALVLLGTTIGRIALPYAWAYGVLAGILIGGRYWSGPRFGAPRPPFGSQYKRRRRKKRRPRPPKGPDGTHHQQPSVGATHG